MRPRRTPLIVATGPSGSTGQSSYARRSRIVAGDAQRRAERRRGSDPVRDSKGRSRSPTVAACGTPQQRRHRDDHLGQADDRRNRHQRRRGRQAQSLERTSAVGRETHEVRISPVCAKCSMPKRAGSPKLPARAQPSKALRPSPWLASQPVRQFMPPSGPGTLSARRALATT